MASNTLAGTAESYLKLAIEASQYAKMATRRRMAADLETAAQDYLERAERALKAEQGDKPIRGV